MAGKYVDIPSIVQVIGVIYNNPYLLDEEDKYFFNEEDFTEEFHKVLFGAIYNLHALGAKQITLNSIEDYLEQRPKKLAIYKANKGAEYLNNLTETAQLSTFDYYYGKMKKMTLLRMYSEVAGMDLSWLYDPNNILDIKKKQYQEDWLDNTSIEEIADLIDKKISDIRLTYAENVESGMISAGEGALELLNELKENPELGYPLYGPLINTVTRGARLKKFYLRSAATGVGKAIPNNVIIPTPQGWKKVGDIKEGDYLFGQDGIPTKVLKIHPQPEKKQIWKITFSDGRVAECCKDHLWEYNYETHRGKAYRVESLEEIYNRTLKLKNGLKNSSNKGYRFHIKLNKAVEYPKKEYSIDPYIMGLLLGDGSFRYKTSQKGLVFSSANEELPKVIAKNLKCAYVKSSDYNYSYMFKPINNLKHNLWVEEILKDYPELWNVKSENKFIPFDYLLGNIEQRYELLAGLLDTDGSIDEKGRITYSTTSPTLRDNVIELTRSLGMISNYLIDSRDKYTTGECYKITIQCKKEIKPKLFKLKRKHDIAIKYASSEKRCEHKEHLAITKIEQLENKTDMTCFTVDNNDHLFLMNDYIVTHNTRSMIADVCSIACDRIFNSELNCWVENGTKEPALFISTEQEYSEIQTMMMAFLSDVDEEHILNGEYEIGEWERVTEAAKLLSKSPLYIEQLPDFSLKDIENTIKKGIREYNARYIFFDYIHSSMKILSEISSKAGIKGLREDNILFMISIRLKDLCNQYGVFIMTATQLNGDFKTAEVYDQNLLRGAKAIADKIDWGAILLEASKEDLESLQNVINSGGFDPPVIKMSIYKNRRGRYKNVLLWCKANRGTCKIIPMFATNYNYELIPMEDLKIKIKPRLRSSVF